VLDRLEQERDQVSERLRALEGSLGDGTPSTESVTAPRGRDDVYPRYWENARTGRRSRRRELEQPVGCHT
jgi:hypothetical protein